MTTLQDLEREGREKLPFVLSSSTHQHQGELNSLLKRFDLSIRRFSTSTSEKLTAILYLMIGLHWSQAPRSGGEPYITHPLRVAVRLLDEFHDIESCLIEIALLHDALEDQLGKILGDQDASDDFADLQRGIDQMKEWLGEDIASGIAFLTFPYWQKVLSTAQMREGSDKDTTLPTGNEYNPPDKGIAAMMTTCPHVALVKFSDLMDNAFRVSSVAAIPRRLKLSRKYLPVLLSIQKTLPQFSRLSALPDRFADNLSACIEEIESFITASSDTV